MALKIPSVTLSRRTKILLGAAVVLLFIAGAVFLSLYSSKALFMENPRLILKSVVVKSSGWWAGKDNYAALKLDLKKGTTNLFSLDLAKLRKKLEEESSICDSDDYIAYIVAVLVVLGDYGLHVLVRLRKCAFNGIIFRGLFTAAHGQEAQKDANPVQSLLLGWI